MSLSLLHGVGKQGEKAGALDGAGQFALLLGRNGGDTAGHDLATLGNVALQKTGVLVVNRGSIVAREGANFATAEKWFYGHGLAPVF